MNQFFFSSVVLFGLNKAVLKISVVFSVIGTFVLDHFDLLFPDYILGVTIFLWFGYASTVLLDWFTGINASKHEAKEKGIEWKFDRQKSLNSWSKHALFIIIIAFIYHLQMEAVRKEFNSFTTNGLTAAQFIFFAYNMITEFISIEDNRFRVNKTQSRLAKLFIKILDAFDYGIINRVNRTMDVTKEEQEKAKQDKDNETIS